MLGQMYRQYKDRAEFFLIYIREAHASDEWQTALNAASRIVVPAPRSYREKSATAQTCAIHLGIEIPVLVDDFEHSTERKYHAWPDRIYLAGKDGRLAYKGRAGPYGFHPREAEHALRIEIGEPLAAPVGNPGEESSDPAAF